MMSPLNENEPEYKQAVHMAALIYKMREKQPLSAPEQQELAGWLNSNESNIQLLESLQDREQLTAELEALLLYDEDNAVAAIFNALGEPLPVATSKRKIKRAQLLIAASLLLLIGAASWFFILRSGPTQQDSPAIVYKTITTKPGEQNRVLLADGSEVWLSAASSITYPISFSGKTREVTITGEVYFNVAKDKTKPFIVTANNVNVQVMGTQFDVMAYGDERDTKVTLLEGSVQVNTGQKAKGKGQREEGESVVLKPGEQVIAVVNPLTTDNSPLTINRSPDLEEVNAWRVGEFRFHETDMTAIMRQIARWYHVKIEYRGTVENIHFSGQVSRKEDLKDLLDILSDTRKVHFEIKNDTTLVVIPGHK